MDMKHMKNQKTRLIELLTELLNKKFQQVLTEESEFKEPQDKKTEKQMWEITAMKEVVYRMMEELEKRKATGPDGVNQHMT